MPDEKKELDDSNLSDEFLPDDLDSDWGEAWESAFEAEDDDASVSEADLQDDFFINEDEETTGAPGSSPASATKSSHSETTAEITELSETDVAQAYTAVLTALGSLLAGFLQKIAALSRALKQRLNALSHRQKLVLGGEVAAVLCVVIIISLFSGSDESTVVEMAPPTTKVAQQEAVSPPPVAEHAENKTAIDNGETSAMLPEKVRKKWSFPDFLIPVASQTGDKEVSFLTIDLTLIVVLDSDQELPSDKKAFVRDIIYQFYTNRPLFELRRYSLARGDMSRELRAWLQKQWPDGPIESIVFNKYQLT